MPFIIIILICSGRLFSKINLNLDSFEGTRAYQFVNLSLTVYFHAKIDTERGVITYCWSIVLKTFLSKIIKAL